MGRRASKGSSAASAPAVSSNNPVQQLTMLRAFCGTAFGETALMDCLKQCGYNVERAAERLITGQYQAPTAESGKKKKSAFVSMVSSPQQSKPAAVATTGTTSLRRTSLQPKRLSSSTSLKSNASKNRTSETASSTSSAPTDSLPRWLLCQRWLSDAVCTTKNGRIGFQEVLEMQHSLSGHAVVRFRGSRIEGRLPDNIARLVTPLLRLSSNNDSDKTSIQPLLQLRGHALMEDSQIPLFAQVPIQLSVYITDPRAFFQLFDSSQETGAAAAGAGALFFQQAKSKKKKRRLPVTEAAFDLLQWAEYGDVPEFQVPDGASASQLSQSQAEAKESSVDDVEDANEEDEVPLNEDDFEEASIADSTAEAKEWDQQVNASNGWMMALPESEDPTGFKDVTLRPYQRQALYWMTQREQQGESREELDKQLALLSELAVNQKPRSSVPQYDSATAEKDIVCDCGPVLISEAARKQSKTVDGQVDPVNHPLWQRRFLASECMAESISFYVSELLSVATHRPPDPPRPCSGGILADSMGLGKTVMLLALILKSKQERPAPKPDEPARPTVTLVVGKLSLLPQWEDELKTKTTLSHRIYYAQPGSKFPTTEEMEGVDVVVTTYGTIQGELTRKNPALLNVNWHRVILDEAHCIKNQKTLASKVCCSLKTDHRWCVSGTIIQNSLDDVFGIMKFLKHEPWCLPPFWKAAITKPMTSNPDTDSAEDQAAGLKTSLDRVRRLLGPLMIRRTKDSVTKDGKPILTLPPVETKLIKVDLDATEREFYNAVLARSLEVFEGYVESGTASKSYIQILSLLQRLRQVCDHIALTVKNRIDGDDWNVAAIQEEAASTSTEAVALSPQKKTSRSDALGKQFLDGLLEKFCSKQTSPRKQKRAPGTESPAKRPKDQAYVSNIAQALSDCVKENSTHVNEECPICLEKPKIEQAVLTPCAHIFCRECLIGYLRDKAPPATNENKPNIGTLLQCPDGDCPLCNETIDAKRIIALSKSGSDGNRTVTSSFLNDVKPAASNAVKRGIQDTQEANPHAVARQILENAIKGTESSKMIAIMKELNDVWRQDPGSKVLIFSQYLGFLDLLETMLRANGIPFFRLDGSLTLKERMVVLDQFRSSRQSNLENASVNTNGGKGTVLLMSMSAGGEGLNLVAASSVFLVDPWWNAAKEDQCINRIHRIGQTASIVRVRKFCVTDTIEEKIVALQERKQYVAEEIYNDAGRAGEMGSARLGIDDFKLIFQKK